MYFAECILITMLSSTYPVLCLNRSYAIQLKPYLYMNIKQSGIGYSETMYMVSS
jgi:hypothetical protein